MALTRSDIALWIEPDTDAAAGTGAASGVVDWSPNQRVVTVAGTAMTFGSGVLPLNGTDNYLSIASAFNLSGATAGFTLLLFASFPNGAVNGRYLFDFGGTGNTDALHSSLGRWNLRFDGTTGDATTEILTATGGGATVLPTSAGDTNVYVCAMRFNPTVGSGTAYANTGVVGGTLAAFQASADSLGGLGAAALGSATLRLGARDSGGSTFGVMGLSRLIIANKVMTDQEIVDFMATVPTFRSLPVNATSGVVDATDPSILNGVPFQEALRAARSRNVHIVIGPNESHGGDLVLDSSGATLETLGFGNLFMEVCGRAVGLSGLGLTHFANPPVSTNTSLHLFPLTTSTVTSWWLAQDGTASGAETIALFDSTVVSGAYLTSDDGGSTTRAIHQLRRFAYITAHKYTAGFATIPGMSNAYEYVNDESFDELSIYANRVEPVPTGSYRIAGFTGNPDTTDYGDITKWTSDGPSFSIPPSTDITVERVALNPSWGGFAFENVQGTGTDVRIGFMDAKSPTPGVRLGCLGLTAGGVTASEVRSDIWLSLMDLVRADHVCAGFPITNDSGDPGTPISLWWDQAQTTVRGTLESTGVGSDGGTRTFSVIVPPEGVMATTGKRDEQRIRANLLASLGVEYEVGLISFPALIANGTDEPDYYDGGVHLSDGGFATAVEALQELVVPTFDVFRGRSRSRIRG